MSIIQAYIFFLKNIDYKDKLNLLLLTLLALFISIFDFLSIILVYPFITTLQKSSDFAVDDSKFIYLQNYFQLTDNDFIKYILFFILLFFLIYNFVNIYVFYKFSYFWNKVTAKFQYKVFKYYTNLKYLDLLNINSSLILRNIIFEVKRFFSTFVAPISTIINLLFIIILLMIGVAYVALDLAFILFGIIFFYYFFIYKFLKKKASNNSVILSNKFDKILKSVDETVNNFVFFKITNLINKQNLDFKKNTQEINHYEALNNVLAILPKYILQIFFFIFGLFFIFYVFKTGNFILYTAKIALIFIVFLRVAPAFQLIYSLFILIRGNFSSVNSLITPLSNKNFNKTGNFLKINNSISSIRLQNLSFRYPAEQKNILNNKNFIFKKNNIYAIKGPSGSGKTTLMNILLGIIDDYDGDIYINKINFKNVNKKEWFSKVTIVPQNIFLNEDTLLNNIILGSSKINDKSIHKVKYAIKLSGLENFSKNLKKGIDTKIINNAKMISGGEKQRIAIARALFKKADVIFFDEPVNNLDILNIKYFINTISNIKKNKIIIIIAHQKELISFCDEVFTLKN